MLNNLQNIQSLQSTSRTINFTISCYAFNSQHIQHIWVGSENKLGELEWGQPGFNPVELPRETILFLSAQSHHHVLFHSPHGGWVRTRSREELLDSVLWKRKYLDKVCAYISETLGFKRQFVKKKAGKNRETIGWTCPCSICCSVALP